MKRSADIVIFADESTNAARQEMLGIFISSYDEKNKNFMMDFISMVEVSSTNSEIVMSTVKKVLRGKGITIANTRFCYFDGTNSCLADIMGFNIE